MDKYAIVIRGKNKGKVGTVEEFPYTNPGEMANLRQSCFCSIRVNRKDLKPITLRTYQDMRIRT